jgi:predicted amidohydrolase YtcJ
VTDATPKLDDATVDLLVDALPQHVTALGGRTGPAPAKIVLPDHEPTDLAELTRAIATAHDAGRPVALHSVTQLTVAIAIAALTAADSMPGDRLEHAAVCDDAAAEQLAALGVVVVTQPSIFRRHARDFLAELDVPDRPHLWRYGGLLRAGVAVVSSSDAPYGDVDPWQAIAAAAQREPADDERVAAAIALGSYLTRPLDIAGPPRAVGAGEPADLCLLSRPLGSALSDVGHLSACVVAVFIGGELTSGPPADGRAFNA